MDNYRCHKLVRAGRIVGLHAVPGGAILALADGEGHQVSNDWLVKHGTALEGGYLVDYEDGYRSWSPAQAFEQGYTLETSQPAPTGSEERANLGLATNAEIEAEMEARRSMGHTAPGYRTVDE